MSAAKRTVFARGKRGAVHLAAPWPLIAATATRAPAGVAMLSVGRPLSPMTISRRRGGRDSCALKMQVCSVADPFRHGITIVAGVGRSRWMKEMCRGNPEAGQS